MANLKVTLEYDGTKYHGFQVQSASAVPTVQDTIEKAIFKLTGEQIRVYGAGRTDAGVHARGQVINFKTASSIPFERFAFALNSVLPSDIVARDAMAVDDDFHARYSAVAKCYSYLIYNAPIPSALQRFYTWHVAHELNVPGMIEAAALLKGNHDFSSFKASDPERDRGKNADAFIRELYRLDISKEGPFMRIVIEGNGFLYNMVRIIVGTLIEVGKGKINSQQIPAIIGACDRAQAGPTAPPPGLCLEWVKY